MTKFTGNCSLIKFTEEIHNEKLHFFVHCKSGILSVLLCFCGYFPANVWCEGALSAKKAEELSLSPSLMPSFYVILHNFQYLLLSNSFFVIFYVICFFSINYDATKNNWLGKFENISEKNFIIEYSKVTSLQFSDCNFTIKRTHHRILSGISTKN